jgi:hypothetical protein
MKYEVRKLPLLLEIGGVRLLAAMFFAAFAMLPGSCRKEPADVTPAFYHWQTALNLTPAEESFLDALQVGKLYVKFFDVTWDQGSSRPVPQASLQVDSLLPSLPEVIPAVFITNEVFRHLPAAETSRLAERIDDKLFRLAAQLPGHHIREVQFDCDWTEATRDRFFQLLEQLREKLRRRNVRISATIRLHQVRYFRRTGVPPVDRGMLMFYNVGRLQEWEEDNSILSLEQARPYLAGFRQYPLPLDLALPAFAWGVVFREGRFIRLINNLRPADLTDTTRFVKVAANRFEVVKSTYLNGYYLYSGDRIRTEAITPALLRSTARLLRPFFKNKRFTLSFYHLDPATIKYLPYGELEDIIRILEAP